MEFSEYQRKSYTAIQEHEDAKEEEMHWALGLGEEAGEVLGTVKHRHYGGGFRISDIVAEIGDTLWHLASICTVFGIDMDDVARYNLLKLNYRYPDGVFDGDRSKRRHELDEMFLQDPVVQGLISKIECDYNSRGERK